MPPAARLSKPFADFPKMSGWSIKQVRSWLQVPDCKRVKEPKVTPLGKTNAFGGSEIWFRQGWLVDGRTEAVRVDARGHKVDAKIPRELPQSYPRVVVNVAAGEPRHMHKELIDPSDEAAYLAGRIQREGNYWQPPSFNDENVLATGDHAQTHIWVTP